MLIMSRHIARFRRRDDGAAIVEFAVVMPILALAFFVVVEFSRLFFNYQAAIQGVRDATRYMARTTAEDICVGQTTSTPTSFGPTEIVTQQGTFYPIIERNMQTEIEGLLPLNVKLLQVRSGTRCVAGTFSEPVVPVAEIQATFEVTFPMIGVLELVGAVNFDHPIQHTVVDQSRVYGI